MAKMPNPADPNRSLFLTRKTHDAILSANQPLLARAFKDAERNRWSYNGVHLINMPDDVCQELSTLAADFLARDRSEKITLGCEVRLRDTVTTGNIPEGRDNHPTARVEFLNHVDGACRLDRDLGGMSFTSSPDFQVRRMIAKVPARGAGSDFPFTLMEALSHHPGMRRYSGNFTFWLVLRVKRTSSSYGYLVSSTNVTLVPLPTFAVVVQALYMMAASPLSLLAMTRFCK